MPKDRPLLHLHTMEKREITTFEDVQLLVDQFYIKAKKSALIGHFFNEVVLLDWGKHMPVIYNFWSDILLGTNLYHGKPMTKHFSLHTKSEMRKEHFEEWLKLWKANTRTHFEGPKASEAIIRAENIANLMSLKVRNF